jgi:hypothetical protein
VPRWPENDRLENDRPRNEGRTAMETLFIILTIVFVPAVLVLVGYVLYELSPFASHRDHYRDPETGARLFESPRLD